MMFILIYFWRSLGDSNPCFRRERARFANCARRTRSSISSTARLACASFCASRTRSRWARAVDRRTDSSRSRLGLTELHTNVALARIRARCFRDDANADLELRRHLIEHRLHDRRHARHHDYIADPEAGRPRHLVENEISPLGMRVMRRRVSLILAPVVFTIRAGWRERADRCRSEHRTPSPQSAVMSPWVGPIPPVVKT